MLIWLTRDKSKNNILISKLSSVIPSHCIINSPLIFPHILSSKLSKIIWRKYRNIIISSSYSSKIMLSSIFLHRNEIIGQKIYFHVIGEEVKKVVETGMIKLSAKVKNYSWQIILYRDIADLKSRFLFDGHVNLQSHNSVNTKINNQALYISGQKIADNGIFLFFLEKNIALHRIISYRIIELNNIDSEKRKIFIKAKKIIVPCYSITNAEAIMKTINKYNISLSKLGIICISKRVSSFFLSVENKLLFLLESVTPDSKAMIKLIISKF